MRYHKLQIFDECNKAFLFYYFLYMLIPSLLIFFSVNLILFPTYWILKKAISEFQRKYEEATSATIDELFLSISPTHLLILHFILGSVGFILGLIIG
ncbi:MAG: hypothetical protein QXI58_07375, partial [Candidatus Micrarchaeia archaeon]